MSLFVYWNVNRFRNPISVSRSELMKISKIGSYNTYTKCIKELDKYGYIRYVPSFNAIRGSLVYLYTFDKADVTAQYSSQYRTDKGTVKALRPSINSINNTNNKTLRELSKNTLDFDFTKKINDEELEEKEKKVPQKKESIFFTPPSETNVVDFFTCKNLQANEALRFFNHYQSNGWKVGGKTPMENWQASATKWILNIEKPKYNPIILNTEKRYDEPF